MKNNLVIFLLSIFCYLFGAFTQDGLMKLLDRTENAKESVAVVANHPEAQMYVPMEKPTQVYNGPHASFVVYELPAGKYNVARYKLPETNQDMILITERQK